jgi:hypothetical protein
MNRGRRPFEEGDEGKRTSTSERRPRKEVSDVSEERFRGASVRTLPRPNKSYGGGRVCADPGCETKLSVYNKWDYCWQHEPVHSYVPRGKRKRRAAA